MTNITLVTESKLYLKDNVSLYDYFDDYSKLFNFLVRRCVHHLNHKLKGETESRYRTHLMREFNITNRMAKAIMRTAKNQLKLLKELAKYQYSNLYKRRRSLYKKTTKLKAILASSSTSSKQRKLAKLRLFWTQMRLNKVNQLISNGFLLSKATKEGVSIHTVNPYNTSKIAKVNYTDRMKLNVHDAASYVIARRFYQYD